MVFGVRAGLLLCLLAGTASALYEDQAGQFDWYQDHVGNVRWSCRIRNLKTFVVGTEKNVVASLSTVGKIGWRHVFAESDAIDAFACGDSTVVTVSDHGQNARAWDAKTGDMLWENHHQGAFSDVAAVFLADGNVAVSRDGHVTLFDGRQGTKTETSAKLPQSTRVLFADENGAIAISGDKTGVSAVGVDFKSGKTSRTATTNARCGQYTVTAGSLVHVCGDSVCSVHIKSGATAAVKEIKDVDRVMNVGHGVVGVSGKDSSALVAVAADGRLSVLNQWEGSSAFGGYVAASGEGDVSRVTLKNGNQVTQDVVSVQGGRLQNTVSHTVAMPASSAHGALDKAFAGAGKGAVLVRTTDHALIYIKNGTHVFTREEGLASIIDAMFVDLPSDREVISLLKEEFNTADEGRPVAMILDRVRAQAHQLQRFLGQVARNPAVLTAWLGIGQSDNEVSMTLDEFGLQKVLVAVSSCGKLYGLHSKKGDLVWAKVISTPEEPFTPVGELFLTRSAYHYPYSARVYLLGSDSNAKHANTIYRIQPITGEIQRSPLGYEVLETMTLNDLDASGARPLLLLDTDAKVHVFPDTEEAKQDAIKKVGHAFMHTVDVPAGKLQGYRLRPQDNEIQAIPTWSVSFDPETDPIVAVAFKPKHDKVKLQFEAVDDKDKILYKYLNPNLLVLATLAPATSTLSVFLLDLVTGGIVHRVSHPNAGGPIHAVQFEHSVLYHFWNKEELRFELVSMDLYENQPIYDRIPFESTQSGGPIVIRQSFVLPAPVSAMGVSTTQQGITYKQLIVGLKSGGVLALDRRMVNPKRPLTKEKAIPGLMQYNAMLVPMPKNMLNYNQTVHNIRNVVTAPTLLESHGMVFVYGLDLFATRLIPSGSFDLLSEEFNKPFLLICVFGILVAGFVTQRMANEKKLKQKWN